MEVGEGKGRGGNWEGLRRIDLPLCRAEPALRCRQENEISHCSISVANSITVGTCSKGYNFQEAEIENLAANEMAND